MCTGAGAPLEISFATFEGIAVKLKDVGRFGVVQSIHGATCTVAVGAEHPEKGVELPEQPETVTAVSQLLSLRRLCNESSLLYIHSVQS